MMIKSFSILKMTKNVLRRQFGNMYGKNKPYEIAASNDIKNEVPTTRALNALPPMESPNVTVKAAILFTILLLLFIVLYLNRETILNTIKRVFTDFKPSEKVDQLEEKYHELTKKDTGTSEQLSALEKKILSFIDQGDKTHKELLERHNTLNQKIENLEKLERTTLDTLEKKEKHKVETEKKEEHGAIQKIDNRINQYRKEQIVGGNGFCYIGYDKNQRECTNVYDGDICMSGQVFPTLEVCLNPNLRP